MKPRLIGLLLTAFGATLPAPANIVFTCDTVSFAANAPSGTCNNLNGSSVSGVYSGLFSNATANIFIKFGNTGVAQSDFNVTGVSYTAYYNALASHTDNLTALASLSAGSNPLHSYGNTNDLIDITAALASALGLTVSNAGVLSDGTTPCDVAAPNCYYGVITIAASPASFYYPTPGNLNGNVIDFYAITEHETDEILGTISCIATVAGGSGEGCNSTTGATDASPADLFRYASNGTRSFLNADTGSPAYFSNNGGQTDIADYVNTAGFGDFGDWSASATYRVQDAEAHLGYYDLSADGGAEVAVLNAVGFNLTTPEPATIGLLGAGLIGLALLRRRHNGKDNVLFE